MVNISRKNLSDEILEKIFRLFFEIIGRHSDKKSFLKIIDEFLSPKEKILLAKRITIFYLLLKGVDQRNISKILKVSNATVSRYAIYLNQKEMEVVKILLKMIKQEKVLTFMQDLLTAFYLQPGVMIGHWQWYWDEKRKKDRESTYGI